MSILTSPFDLPLNYVPVEYIESHGTEWIDTGLKESDFDTIKLTADVMETSNAYGYLLGNYDTSGNHTRFFYRKSDDRVFGYTNAYAAGVYDVSLTRNTKHNFEVGNNYFKIDGVNHSVTATPKETSTTQNLWIFTSSPDATRSCSMKLYSLSCYKTNTLVLHLIPVKKKSTNEYGMYDLVNMTFYGNSGTGAFTGGNEIQRVEYLESNGAQYINTHIPSDSATSYNGYKLESTLQVLDISTSSYIEGKYENGQYYLYRASGGNFQVAYGCTYNNTNKLADTDKHTFVYNHINGTTTVLCDGTEILTKENETAGGAIILCGTIQGNRLNSRHWEKKIWHNDELIMHFLPVKVGTEYAMYDIVNSTIHRNAGTGSFTGGRVINKTPVSFVLGKMSRYQPATSSDTTKHPQTLNGWKTVDLGTFDYDYGTTFGLLIPDNIPDFYSTDCNAYCGKYRNHGLINSVSLLEDGEFGYNSTTRKLYFKDSHYTSASSFKTAMSGVYFLYRLATSDASVWNFTCDITTKTNNLFDKSAITVGKYLDNTGVSVANTKWNISDYMPVEGGATYYQALNTPGTAPRTCWYDANKTFISAVAQQNGGTQTAPANAKYCRMSVWETDLDTAMFIKGSTAQSYEPYGNIFGYLNQTTNEFVKAFGATGTISSNKTTLLTLKKGVKLLPDEYQPLEYLQSSGSQWIDTGVQGNNNVEVSVTAITPSSSSAVQLFGNNINSSKGFTCNVGNSTGNVSRFGGDSFQGKLFVDDDSYHTYNVSQAGLFVDGTSKKTWSSQTFTQDGTLYLLAAQTSSGASNIMPNGTKIKASYVKHNDTLVRHFIPAKRISDNVLGMYDLANSGKNLVDKSTIALGQMINDSGVYQENSASACSGYIKVDKNTTYTLKYETNTTASLFKIRVHSYDGSKVWQSMLYSSGLGAKQATFTTGANTEYIRLSIGNNPTDVQLEKGNTATTYEPFPFYTNNGTGTFTAGNPISPFKEVKTYSLDIIKDSIYQ